MKKEVLVALILISLVLFMNPELTGDLHKTFQQASITARYSTLTPTQTQPIGPSGPISPVPYQQPVAPIAPTPTPVSPTVITAPAPPTITPTPTVYNTLKSDFLKNDLVADSIVKGINYRLNLSKFYYIYGWRGEINVSSFEYKLVSALRQLGYHKLNNPLSILNNFQRKHNLIISDVLDRNTIMLIDSELASKEVLDKAMARLYPITTSVENLM